MELSVANAVALVLSSSLASAALSAVASRLLATKEFERDYHREITKRRLDAYEVVSGVIGYFRGASYDNESRTAHIAFAGGSEQLTHAQLAIASAMMQSIWLEPDLRDQLVALNRLLITVPDTGSPKEIFEGGARIYEKVGALREEMEATVARNLQALHGIGPFLKRKERSAKQSSEPRWESVPKNRVPGS